jgi:hypothetical protein
MRDCGGRKQVDGQSTHEKFNLAAVPVFPAQVVRVYIPHPHFFILVSSARSNRTHGIVSYIFHAQYAFSDVLYVSQVNCISIVNSNEPGPRCQALSS